MASEGGVRVLSLDGGGTRLLLTLGMLKELERQSGKRVHELFDLVCGTSTGAILALNIQVRHASCSPYDRLHSPLPLKIQA
eukprot:2543105-Pleurochrysis_carterae.AAC.2